MDMKEKNTVVKLSIYGLRVFNQSQGNSSFGLTTPNRDEKIGICNSRQL